MKGAAHMPAKKADTPEVNIPPIEIKYFRIRLVGDSPLIVHAWSAKAKQQMLDKQMGKARPKKEKRDPQHDYEEAFYRTSEGAAAFPTLAFKSAAVSAARQVEGLTMTYLRGAFHVVGELVEVEGAPRVREDMVNIGSIKTVADLRYRPEFVEWAVELVVRMNVRALTLEQLLHLFNQAGFSVGIGEWRPERKGNNGMFHVEDVSAMDPRDVRPITSAVAVATNWNTPDDGYSLVGVEDDEESEEDA
jgi:hypothetical protein